MPSTSNIRQRICFSSISSTSTFGRIEQIGWSKECRRRDLWGTTMATCSGIESSRLDGCQSKVDGLEHVKHMVESETTMDERNTSWLRRLMHNLLSCTREHRRDVVAYPPLPAPARPSFRDGESIVPPVEPPRRRKRKSLTQFQELRTTQETELSEPFEYEWASAPDVAGGSSCYMPSQEHDMFPKGYLNSTISSRLRCIILRNNRPLRRRATTPQPPPPPPPLQTPVEGRVKRNPRAVVQRAREEGGGRDGGRRGRGHRGGCGGGKGGEQNEAN
ncbi:unnamed protein product [Linum tenue]|uniref:Uncharacterized protein n=1 Tax=Linum tenue TaxID=586396 RepID=A0AAV0S0I6_9ROSI|nr:unnamed protein product [Linum tenue]